MRGIFAGCTVSVISFLAGGIVILEFISAGIAISIFIFINTNKNIRGMAFSSYLSAADSGSAEPCSRSFILGKNVCETFQIKKPGVF